MPQRRSKPVQPPRTRILVAALSTFSSRGVEGSSIADVAKAAGMSKQALMHHFRTKEELHGAVYGHLAEQLRTVFPSVASEFIRAPDDYGSVIALVAKRLTESPEIARFLVHELLARPDELVRWVRAEAAPWLGLVNSVIERDKAVRGRGEQVDIDAHLTVLTALMLVLSALVPRTDKRWWARVQTAALRVMRLGSHLQA
ncbi:MAG: TetR family transcriptional regulator [Archangium sp.]|nr:TetR family transcriptional regulator [Archangium sp.]